MIVGFTEENKDVNEKNIKIIKNKDWTLAGTRYF